MKQETLENLGLKKSEIKVYLTLLESNSASASEISEKSDMHRKNVYDALYHLHKLGLIGYSQIETKRIFHATDPQKLVDIIDSRKKEMQEILPELKALYRSPSSTDNVTLFTGKEGLKTIFEDILNSKKNYDKLGTEEKFKEFLPHYYSQYQKKKSEKRIHCRAIYSENERNKDFVTEFSGEVRFLPKKFINPATTIIYGHKIAIIIWKEIPIGILIDSEGASESYKYYFETLWMITKS